MVIIKNSHGHIKRNNSFHTHARMVIKTCSFPFQNLLIPHLACKSPLLLLPIMFWIRYINLILNIIYPFDCPPMQIFHNKCFNYIWAVRINIHERIITYKVWVKMPCLLTFIMSHVCMFGCCCCRDDKSTVNSRQIVNIFTFSAQIADNQCYWKASFTNKIDILSKRFDHFILISSPSW